MTLPSPADRALAVVIGLPSEPVLPLQWSPFKLDSLTRCAVQTERSPRTDQWAHRLRHFGQPEVFLPVVVGLLLSGRVFRRRRLVDAGRRAAIALGLVGLVGTGIKFITGRVRPSFAVSPAEFRPLSGAGASPSGHTDAAFALAGSLALETNPVAGTLFLLGAAGTGWSRINDNKHWLSDVIGAAMLALTIVGLVHHRDRRRIARAPPAPATARGSAADILLSSAERIVSGHSPPPSRVPGHQGGSMRRHNSLLVAMLIGSPAGLHAQALETEDARTLPAGRLIVGYNVEFQTSSTGHEIAIPFSGEIGLTDRLEFLIEPVPYTSIRPKTGPRATGAGDMEATLIGLLAPERGGRPAIALGAEVKFPTARNTLIGTGKTDFAGYLILSKHLGPRWDTHVNAGYTIQGKPAGANVGNLLSGAFAVTFRATPTTELFSEILGNASIGGSGSENVLNPEITGGELLGSLGVGHNITTGLFGSVSLTYDNSRALLIRSGFTLRLH